MILSLFLPVQVIARSMHNDLTMLCESVIIILGKLQNSCMVKLSSSLNIFYCQNIYSNGVGSHVLTTLVSTLPLHSIYTQ